MGTAPATEQAIYWVDRPVEVDCRNGVIIARVHSGGKTIEFRGTPDTLVATLRNITACLARMAKEHSAKILRFPRKYLPIRIDGEDV
jgi:hypothetical protein